MRLDPVEVAGVSPSPGLMPNENRVSAVPRIVRSTALEPRPTFICAASIATRAWRPRARATAWRSLRAKPWAQGEGASRSCRAESSWLTSATVL